MEPHDHSPAIDPLMCEAIAWLVRLKSGEATLADADEFKRWRDQSPQHAAALKRAVKLWRTFEEAAATTAAGRSKRPPRLISHAEHVGGAVSRRAILRGGAIAAAAATAGYLVIRPPLSMWPSLRELSADYRTGKGQQLKVALGTGVSLDLGTLTSIVVESEREIRLLSGEAAVVANTSRGHILTVLAADGRIMAANADFDARCIDGKVTVTCVRGALEVRKTNQTVQLLSGQRVSYSAAGIDATKSVDIDQATAWRSGVLIFNDRPLAQVVEEINRYRPGRIFITSDTLGARIVNGTFHRDRLDNFVIQVRQLFGARITRLPAGVILLS